LTEGMTLGRREGNGEQVGKRSNSLELLALHGFLEITRHRIAAEKHFYMDAADEWAGFEFVYVVSGRLSMGKNQDKTVFEPGEYLHHRGLPERAYFRAETDVELLMVSSPPSYHLIRDEIQEILALARSVEEKDANTEGHCSRLERLAILTGERLGLSGDHLVDLSYGAYLHDVGKVRVPDSILLKTGRLTDEEWIEMRRHTEHGRDMLREKEFLKGAAEIVVGHHERYDGSGYPKGLKGNQIPIGARVVAVVDAYDAIRSTRPYKKAESKAKAIEELRKGSGTQFDPRVVRAFVEAIGGADEE